MELSSTIKVSAALVFASVLVTAQEAPPPPAPASLFTRGVPLPPEPPRPAARPMPPAPVLAPEPLLPPDLPEPALAPMPALAPLPPMPVEPEPALMPLPALAPLPPEPPGAMAFALAAPAPMGLAFLAQDARDSRRAEAEVRRAERFRRSHEESYYSRGKGYLDRREYDRAIDEFNKIIEEKGSRADGALYWRAYAQNKIGKRDEALATIAELRKSYPQSRWLDDAKALELEVKQASGQAVAPENASDEDLKLLALNSLINTDPERSVPMLEKLLKSSASPKLKERALFVLAQSRSQSGRNILAQVARGGTNPDLQLKAIEYLGVNGTQENQQMLADAYKNSSDINVKRAILRSFMIAHNRDHLMQIARAESNPELKIEAVRQLSVMGGASELYSSESSPEVKRAIIQGMIVSGDSQKLLDIARTEKDPKLRSDAINVLGAMGRSKSGDALATLYRQENDPNVKRSILNALFIQSNAPAIIEIAKRETDPALKREAVQKLSVMKSKEATDYLMELLNK